MNEKAGELVLDHIAIRLGTVELVSLNCSIKPGEVLTVMGPSGSGKSSLLAYIGGFLDKAFTASGKVFSGELELTALPAEARHTGILFQDPLLFPHMSVAGNIVFAIVPDVKGKAARLKRAEDMLAGVGLADMGARDPDTLSGGQKARVALARVLVSSPRALLLDEPFSKLDQTLREQMRALVFEKAREAGLPVIMVTHDEADAVAAGGAIIRVGA
ncbi:ATP-binding cassette domain-containing protein [Mesorhizobium sp. NBSH29]|uniref:ATP-binding cassette domain-containing protein n=1 Tax=Mesorhizobium sp. NBSH29 TaxID=2654249 RepID=UPI0018968D72|nr:ATP-binding cassette domain-containing protein [Mesorhizobium sp. NBSH29]QPC86272.1 ATP-binding cassette domain-containing protein [Mesorhizobium sp. NBSH29]